MDIPTIFTQPENFYSLACYTYILSSPALYVLSSDGSTCADRSTNGATTSILHAARLHSSMPQQLCSYPTCCVLAIQEAGSLHAALAYSITPCASPCSTTASSRCDTCGARSSLLPIFAHHFCCLVPSSSSSFFIRTTCFSHTRDYGNVLWYA